MFHGHRVSTTTKYRQSHFVDVVAELKKNAFCTFVNFKEGKKGRRSKTSSLKMNEEHDELVLVATEVTSTCEYPRSMTSIVGIETTDSMHRRRYLVAFTDEGKKKKNVEYKINLTIYYYIDRRNCD
ncbi:hypothetical protein PUN28_008447 [Cardiocondyla obscurior]|uniref:Uncharacterized protein n=1 Tax=Cardiocondyla obscurior TaxID=286306 RepID=A0AAW2G2Z1_9HYME